MQKNEMRSKVLLGPYLHKKMVSNEEYSNSGTKVKKKTRISGSRSPYGSPRSLRVARQLAFALASSST